MLSRIGMTPCLRVVAGVLVVALWLASAQVASASAWRMHTLSIATGSLSGVSCQSKSFCMAVGSVYGSLRITTLAELWDGSTWTRLHTANSPTSQDSQLSAVSCTSETACTAVGLGGGRTLAERWNGLSWSIQTTPDPVGGAFDAVSCAKARACTAVGGTSPAVYGQALAEGWNGSRWSMQRIPKVVNASNESLLGVSCASQRSCAAVGAATEVSGFYAVALHWNGLVWSTQLVYGDGVYDYEPYGVSCGSLRACTAVGLSSRTRYRRAAYTGFWARLDKFTWSEPSSSVVSSHNNLTGVSCTSAKSCMAVGGSSRAYAERWNGSAWSFQPISFSPAFALNAVSCTSKTFCIAVGDFTRGTSEGDVTYPIVAIRS